MASYVRFQRGSQAAYDNLAVKDNDTLYFIYASADASKGSLYLGSKLISGSTSQDTPATEIDLGDIKNVLINEGLADKDILTYDAASQKWVNTPIDSLKAVVMKGATAELAGEAGYVPAPQAGDEGKFLRGDGTWADALSADQSAAVAKIDEIDTKVGTLTGDESVEGSVANQIQTAVTNLIDGAPETYDTLKEIADYIEGDGKAAADLTSKVADLDTRVTNIETFQTETETKLKELDERMQWVEMKEEVTPTEE